MKTSLRIATLTGLAAAAIAAVPASASAACSVAAKRGAIAHVNYQGMKSQLFCYGPLTIKPGQNTIEFPTSTLRPSKPGYITRFDPDLVYEDGTVPGVDVLHLHHVVWVKNLEVSNPIWAAGEEKTIIQMPQGFGWRSLPTDTYVVNHMIHNLYPAPAKVYVTWRVDFVPDTLDNGQPNPAAATIKPAKTLWLDTAGLKAYPVFDALRGMGSGGRYTFPDQATGAERSKIGNRATYTVPKDMTILGGIGHLHPGGLAVNLKAQRGSTTKSLFSSEAKYFEPAGAVSWDVAMTATPSNWRIKLKKDDKLKVSALYDVSRASWYESMGIFPVSVYDGTDKGGVDPFVSTVPTTGAITHGHLDENNNHGGTSVEVNDATALISGADRSGNHVNIKNFIYTLGDLSLGGTPGRPPTVKRGQSITFSNEDSTGRASTDYIFHTITACKNPCNKNVGIAYPRADGAVEFDSGQLGFGPAYATPTANRRTWNTPTNLAAGTYSYFCRVHPFMRGAFRVVN